MIFFIVEGRLLYLNKQLFVITGRNSKSSDAVPIHK